MKKDKRAFVIIGGVSFIYLIMFSCLVVVWSPPPVFLGIAPPTSLQAKNIASDVLAFDFSTDLSTIYFIQRNEAGSVDVYKYDLDTSEKELLYSSLVKLYSKPVRDESSLYDLGVVDNNLFVVLLSVEEEGAYLWAMYFDNERFVYETPISGGERNIIKRDFWRNSDVEYDDDHILGLFFQKLYKVTTTSSREGVKIVQMEKNTYAIDSILTKQSACRIYYNGKFISVSDCQSSSSSYYVGSNGKLYVIDGDGTLLEIGERTKR